MIKSVSNPNEIKIISKTVFSASHPAKQDAAEGERCRTIQNEDSIEQKAKRLHFMSSNLIRFINQEGIDLLYDIELMKVVCFAK